MRLVPKEFENAIIYAITPHNDCLGIKIFSEPYNSDMNGNIEENLDSYVDRCLQSAVELKQLIENGTFDNNNPKIVHNPRTEHIDLEFMIKTKKKQLMQLFHLKNENAFIDLGRLLVQSVMIGKPVNVETCKICLGEIGVLTKSSITPLMLKKNPQIVHWVEKLTRFSEYRLQNGTELSTVSKTIRERANSTLTALKNVMKFDGNHDEFMPWFLESSRLFQEITRNMSKEDISQLTIDPEIEFLEKGTL